MDGGPEPIADPSELAQVRRQARKVHLVSLLAALALTLVAFAIPTFR